MKLTLKQILVLLLSTILLISCGGNDDDNNGGTALSAEKDLLSFTVGDFIGTINNIDKTITASVPFDTDLSSITPVITVSQKASYTPAGSQNFSSPVIYTVTAEDGSKAKYVVTITKSPQPESNAEREALIAIYNSSIGNILDWNVENEALAISTWEGVTVNDEGYVVQLNLFGKNISLLPENIDNLTKLQELYLGDNNISSLPESIGDLIELRILDIGGNQLTSLPTSIGNLTNLTKLALALNQLQELPEAIINCSGLQQLYIDHNEITSLPESIGDLTELSLLTAGTNQLTALPVSIGNLTSLTILGLYMNQLQDLPESIVNLTGLEQLYLENNSSLSLTTEQCTFITSVNEHFLDDGICE